MPYKTFTYAAATAGDVPELNAFLASHSIVASRHEFVSHGDSTLLVFVVEYTQGPASSDPVKKPESARVDYQAVLNPDDFLIFDRLRQVRTEIAEEVGAPAYTIFTNAHLAAMVEQRVKSLEEMLEIKRIPKTRVNTYGGRFLDVLTVAWAEEKS